MGILVKVSFLRFKAEKDSDPSIVLKQLIEELAYTNVTSKDCQNLLTLASLKRDFEATADFIFSQTSILHTECINKLAHIYKSNSSDTPHARTKGMDYTDFRKVCWLTRLLPELVKETDLQDVYKYLEVEREQASIQGVYPVRCLEVFYLAIYLLIGKSLYRKEEQGFDELERVSVDEMVDEGFLPSEIEVDEGENEEDKIYEIMKACNKWKVMFRHISSRT